MVQAKLIIRPAPNELADVIRDDKSNEADKKGEETAFNRAGAVCRREFGERIKTLCRCSDFDLVETRKQCERT